ncbi:MAG: hypothetical protein ACI89X_003616 [Planctomycetota bacterium]
MSKALTGVGLEHCINAARNAALGATTNMIVRTFLLLLLGVTHAGAVSAQSTCVNSGSTMVVAALLPSPLALGCAYAPNWPMWHQFVPPHRSPSPHAGFHPGRGEAVPVIIVQYQCTGLLLSPVIASGFVNMGYVIDMPEYPCNG